MDIAVFGDRDFVMGFRLAGVKRIYEAAKRTGAQQELQRLIADQSIGILIVSDNDVKGMPHSFKEALADNVRPVVIPVGKEDEGDIRERIKRAVGIDLYARK